MTDQHRVDTIEALRVLYRHPAEATANKERPTIDPVMRQFLEHSRFAVVGTFDADGNADASPRGGESGFIRVIDEHHIAIADLGGNNRLDTLQNIIATRRVGLIFVVPGQSETVRINGDAWITTDPDVLSMFQQARVPKTAIVVHVQTTYIHCAKAFHRSGMWDPNVWADLASTPDGAAIFSCQLGGGVTTEQMRGWLDDDYTASLTHERTPG